MREISFDGSKLKLTHFFTKIENNGVVRAFQTTYEYDFHNFKVNWLFCPIFTDTKKII